MRRRTFIDRSIIGIAGTAIASSSIASILVSCSGSNKKISLALIGCDDAGVKLITEVNKRIQNINIKYVFDFDRGITSETTKIVRQTLGYFPEATNDMQTIYKDGNVQGVFIFLPEHWRALATVQACQAGKDVYVDGLPAHSVWEGQKMVEAAKKYKRVIQCGFPLRNAPGVLRAKEYIRSGKLGNVVQINIFSLQERSQGKTRSNTEKMAKPEGLDWDYWIGPALYQPFNKILYSGKDSDGGKGFRDFNTGRMASAYKGLDLARLVVGDPADPSSLCSYGSNYSQASMEKLPESQSVVFDYDKFVINCETGAAYAYMKNTPVSLEKETVPVPWFFRSNRVEVYGQKGLMYIDIETGSWQVLGNEGKILGQDKGADPMIIHVQNFIDCIQSRDLPGSNIGQAHLSGTLAHLANISYQVGNKQLLFDAGKEKITNNEEANHLLKSAYRKEYMMPGTV